MSYYTLIEDENAIKLSFTGPVELPALPERFRDWSIVIMGGYIVGFTLLSLVIAIALDNSNWKQLKDMEEVEVSEMENRAPGSTRIDFMQDDEKADEGSESTLSLVNYIFYRKMRIDSYSEAILPLTGPPVEWSQRGQRSCSVCCQLFKLFMVRVHPLISIFGHFDISILRADRLLLFVTRLNLCALTCYFFLRYYRLTPSSSLREDDIYAGLTEAQIALIPNVL